MCYCIWSWCEFLALLFCFVRRYITSFFHTTWLLQRSLLQVTRLCLETLGEVSHWLATIRTRKVNSRVIHLRKFEAGKKLLKKLHRTLTHKTDFQVYACETLYPTLRLMKADIDFVVGINKHRSYWEQWTFLFKLDSSQDLCRKSYDQKTPGARCSVQNRTGHWTWGFSRSLRVAKQRKLIKNTNTRSISSMFSFVTDCMLCHCSTHHHQPLGHRKV